MMKPDMQGDRNERNEMKWRIEKGNKEKRQKATRDAVRTRMSKCPLECQSRDQPLVAGYEGCSALMQCPSLEIRQRRKDAWTSLWPVRKSF